MATLVPLGEAADLLGVSRQHVSRLAKAGELHPQIAPCGCALYEADELLARRRNPPPRGPRPKHENPVGTPTPEEYIPEVGPVEEPPDPLASDALIRVLEPCSVMSDGRAVASFQPGPYRTEERYARMLIAEGRAVRIGQ